MSLAFLFPGQGSQAVGMGFALAEAFPAARRVLEEGLDELGRVLAVGIHRQRVRAAGAPRAGPHRCHEMRLPDRCGGWAR